MADMFDYLMWRGDIPFAKVGLTPVDALLLSTLSYIDYSGIVSDTPFNRRFLRDVAAAFLQLPDCEERVRVKQDIELLQMAAETERFGSVGVTFYRSVFDAEKEIQFAAITFLLDDGTAVLAYRGTDYTLVGWKEDFNMTFQESIPAQHEALRYLEDFAQVWFAINDVPDTELEMEKQMRTSAALVLTGHSKGGNLAVYAAARTKELYQQRILEIHNQDGPGFPEPMMKDEGYQRIVPKIFTFIPQSSVVGRLLEHEEPYIVVKSKQIGPLQHDPYSWEILGRDFIYLEEINESSKFIDQTLKNWLTSMNVEERNQLVDVIFEILMSGGAVSTKELVRPKHIRNYVKTLSMDEKKRQVISDGLSDLVQSMRNAQQSMES